MIFTPVFLIVVWRKMCVLAPEALQVYNRPVSQRPHYTPS
jgi:hypothetical protein